MIVETTEKQSKWDIIITAKKLWFHFNFKEIWNYKDLLALLVKRDFTTFYKQTIFGPIWFFIQPLLTTVVFAFIFNSIAEIGTSEIPPYLFYLSGIISWNYFSNCFLNTSNSFLNNANLMSKVYFPRVIVPFSIVISNLGRFIIQFLLFIILYFYYALFKDFQLKIYPSFLITLPFLVIQMAILGQGLGMIAASLTTKYRDLNHLLGFGTQLLMYASPIIYPLESVPDKYRTIIFLNPMTSIIENFRFVFFQSEGITQNLLIYSISSTIVLFLIGILIFNRIEKDFTDTI